MPITTTQDMILAAVTDLNTALQMPKQETIVPHLLPIITAKLEELSELLTNNNSEAANDPREDDSEEDPQEDNAPAKTPIANPQPSIILPKTRRPKNVKVKFASSVNFQTTSSLKKHQQWPEKSKVKLSEAIARGENYGKPQPEAHPATNFYEPLRVDDEQDDKRMMKEKESLPLASH